MRAAELAVAAPTSWQIDSTHTGVEFAVKHLMISTVKGHFSDVSGTLSGDINNPETFALDVKIGVASIDTRQDQRDGHLRSPDFFDAEKFPTILGSRPSRSRRMCTISMRPSCTCSGSIIQN